MRWTTVFPLLAQCPGKDYTGGFAGIATLGDVADIDESQGLLVIVKDLLTGLLNGKFTNMDLLNLVGASTFCYKRMHHCRR